MKKVKWGILSTGKIANKFAADFKSVSNGEIIAIVSRNQTSADAFAKAHGIPHAFDSYQSFFANEDIDAVYIASPHNYHQEHARMALLAKKAVLCEKPLTIGYATSKALIELAQEKETLLMEGLWTYFLPAIIQAKKWVSAGEIGTVKKVIANFGFEFDYDPKHRLFNPDLAGGAVWDLGIYPIALASHFIEGAPERIHYIRKNAPTGVDQEMSILLDYGHAQASLFTSSAYHLPNNGVIIGTKGHIEIPEFWQASQANLFKNNCKVDTCQFPRTTVGLNYEATAFNEFFIAGKKSSDIVSFEKTLLFQKIMDTVLQ